MTNTLSYRVAYHNWPKNYHPLLGSGSTFVELREEIRKALANNRTVFLADCGTYWRITVCIPC